MSTSQHEHNTLQPICTHSTHDHTHSTTSSNSFLVPCTSYSEYTSTQASCHIIFFHWKTAVHINMIFCGWLPLRVAPYFCFIDLENAQFTPLWLWCQITKAQSVPWFHMVIHCSLSDEQLLSVLHSGPFLGQHDKMVLCPLKSLSHMLADEKDAPLVSAMEQYKSVPTRPIWLHPQYLWRES